MRLPVTKSSLAWVRAADEGSFDDSTVAHAVASQAAASEQRRSFFIFGIPEIGEVRSVAFYRKACAAGTSITVRNTQYRRASSITFPSLGRSPAATTPTVPRSLGMSRRLASMARA